MKRFNIKEILQNAVKRRQLFIDVIVATQAREGIITTAEQAARAYDSVALEFSK